MGKNVWAVRTLCIIGSKIFGRGVVVKRLNTGKLQFDSRFAVASDGMVAHIEKAVDAIHIGILEGREET